MCARPSAPHRRSPSHYITENDYSPVTVRNRVYLDICRVDVTPRRSPPLDPVGHFAKFRSATCHHCFYHSFSIHGGASKCGK